MGTYNKVILFFSAKCVCKVSNCYWELQFLIIPVVWQRIHSRVHTHAYLLKKIAWHGFLYVWCVTRDLNYFSECMEAEWLLYFLLYTVPVYHIHCSASKRTGALCWSAVGALYGKVLWRNLKRSVTRVEIDRMGFSFGKCNLILMGQNKVQYWY